VQLMVSYENMKKRKMNLPLSDLFLPLPEDFSSSFRTIQQFDGAAFNETQLVVPIRLEILRIWRDIFSLSS